MTNPSTDQSSNLPADRVRFADIPYRGYFRLPQNNCPFQKVAQKLADVPGDFRCHPSAPRSGFMHPGDDTLVIPMTDLEFSGLRRKPPAIGLVGIEFHKSGILYLVFDTPESRMQFLPRLAEVLDPACREAIRTGRGEGTTCMVGIHCAHLRANLPIQLTK